MDDEEARSSSEFSKSEEKPVQDTASPAVDVPLREDQVQNAVSFLSHPKVRGSPKASKVSFLQQKGLTEAEIDEAFRRVPETPVPALPIAQTYPHTAPPASNALATTANHLAPPALPTYSQAVPAQEAQQPVRWSQVALGAGFVAASGYALKTLFWPYLHDKYAAWRGVPSPPEPEPASVGVPPSEVAAVADAIRAQTAELASSIEALKALVAGLDKQRTDETPEDRITAGELRQELSTIASTLNEIAGPHGHTPAPTVPPLSMESEISEIKALLAEYLKTPRSGDGAQTPQGDLLSTPVSYRSASERIMSGGPSPSMLGYQAPRGSTNAGSRAPQQQQQRADSAGTSVVNPSPEGTPNDNDGSIDTPVGGRHPASYMEVLEMLERGETPPGIRDDIDDKPPNPDQPPPPSRMKPKPKPWEKTPAEYNANGSTDNNTNRIVQDNAVNRGGAGVGAVLNASRTGGVDAQPGGLDLSPIVTEDTSGGLSVSAISGTASGSASSIDKPASTVSPLHELFSAGHRPMSIFEAATSAENNPSVIAGRLSPADQRRRGVATPTALFPDTAATSPIVRSPTVHSPLRSPSPRDDSAGEGSGLGRPASRTWKPPPIPMPTLSGGNGIAPGGREEEGEGNRSEKPTLGQPASASQSSLGEDFSSG